MSSHPTSKARRKRQKVIDPRTGRGSGLHIEWPKVGGRGRRALLIGPLRHPIYGQAGVGDIDWNVRRGASGAQGTTTRGARRRDIK